jgi:hypothetical protein
MPARFTLKSAEIAPGRPVGTLTDARRHDTVPPGAPDLTAPEIV